MNSYTHTNYTFNKVTKQVTLTGFSGVLQNIKYIKDLTADTVIFDPLSFTALGGTLAGNVLTLTFDTNTVAFNNSDTLEIIIEAGSIIGNNGTISAAGTSSITTGGTAQTLFAANTSRMGWSIQNTSNDDLYVNDLGTATTASYKIAPGNEYNPNSVNSSLISILGQTTGQTFVAREWNLPNISGSTLFVQGATPAGQQPVVSSYPVVIASNQTTSVDTLWFANIAGTGYSIGDILKQVVQSDGGVIRTTWFNLTLSTILSTPPTISNLSIYNNTQSYKQAASVYYNQNQSISTISNMVIIRNTNSFPLKVSKMTISMASNTWATTNQAQIMGITTTIVSGSSTVVGGTLLNSTKCIGSTYSADSTVQFGTNWTSITGGTVFPVGGQIITCPSIGPQTSISNATAGYGDQKWFEGTIIPANSCMMITGSSVGSTPVTPAGLYSIVLTNEL